MVLSVRFSGLKLHSPGIYSREEWQSEYSDSGRGQKPLPE
jgi:hypothetical protein